MNTMSWTMTPLCEGEIKYYNLAVAIGYVEDTQNQQ